MRRSIGVIGVYGFLLIPASLQALTRPDATAPRTPVGIAVEISPDAVPVSGYWNPIDSLPSEQPAARLSSSAIYDPVGQRMILFGGWGGPTLDDTWSLSLVDPSPGWQRIATAGPRPPARLEHTSIYDPVRHRMIIFGGKNTVAPYFMNDAWELDLSGAIATWRLLVTEGTPPSARETRSIYDPVGDRMVIFGGFGNLGHLNETWTLDLAGTPTWHQLSTAQSPAPRRGQSAIYDPIGQRMLVFGGYDDVAFKNDLWALDLSGSATPNWQPLAASGVLPSARYGHSAVYDPDRREMTVFGGFDGASIFNGVFLEDQHVLSLSNGAAWSKLDVAPHPSPRDFYTMIFDPPRHRAVLFGGNDGRTFDDTWSFDPAVPAWTLISFPAREPSARLSAGAAFDRLGDRLILFGGWGGSPFDDTWSLALNQVPPQWSLIAPPGSCPSPRLEHTVVYDSRRNRMILFGGKDGTQFFNDVWQLDLSGVPIWSPMAVAGTPPSPRETRGIYDPVRDRVVFFGGFSPPDHLAETWILDLSGSPTWRQLSPRGMLPGARRGHTAIYDSGQDRMVIFGGYDDQRFFNDVWFLPLSDPDRWRQLPTRGTAPSPRYGIASAYLPDRQQMVIFGGWNGQFLSDGFVLTLDRRPTWSPLTSSTPPPPPRDFHSLIYDAPRSRLILHAGNNGIPLADLWEFQVVPPPIGAGATADFEVQTSERGFALEGFAPNPVFTEARVAFSLPDSRPALLEVFDIAGRRVSSNRLVAPQAGRQVVRLGAGVLSPGLYLIRLSQGERVVVARGAVLH
jgi:hypothetical protein